MTDKDGVRTLTIEGAYTRTLDGDTRSASLEGTFKNTVKADQEKWTGKGTLEVTKYKVKTVWTVTPDLIFADGGLSGTVTVQKKEGSAIKLKAALTVLLTAGTEIPELNAENAVDLTGMDETQARAAVMGEWPAMSRIVVRLMASLPESVRALLTHDLRTDAWMNGPAAPVMDPEPDEEPWDTWIVVEEE